MSKTWQDWLCSWYAIFPFPEINDANEQRQNINYNNIKYSSHPECSVFFSPLVPLRKQKIYKWAKPGLMHLGGKLSCIDILSEFFICGQDWWWLNGTCNHLRCIKKSWMGLLRMKSSHIQILLDVKLSFMIMFIAQCRVPVVTHVLIGLSI